MRRRRRAQARPRWLLAVLGLLALVALGGCEIVPPSASPTPSAVRPAIEIDETWTAANGQWTFTGRVDPFDDPTDVVLEVGPDFRQFDTRLPVAEDLAAAGPLTVTTREIPELDEICVRFTATNSAGTSASRPLCFPHDLPSIAPAAPAVEIDETGTTADGEWTFTGRVDPGGDPTDVVLEVGPGPATAGQFPTTIPAADDLTEPATLTISTRDVPSSDEICVRFTATNRLGTSSTTPLCVPGPGSAGPAASPP